jgi:hypothetical protein
MSHWLIGRAGWEEVADTRSAGWPAGQAAPRPRARAAGPAQQADERDQRPGASIAVAEQVEALGQQRPEDQAGADQVARQRKGPLRDRRDPGRPRIGDQDDQDAARPAASVKVIRTCVPGTASWPCPTCCSAGCRQPCGPSRS